MTRRQRFVKRSFDVVFSFLGLILFGWLIVLAWMFASLDTRSNGFFMQNRVGMYGEKFRVIKIKTMRPIIGFDTTVTSETDPRITKLGGFLRATKIDELPQLFNVLLGQMSFVGPRPDVPGYADVLEGNDRIVLSVRPGITGPASLKFRNEESLLALQKDPDSYNRDVIWPEKVKINVQYIVNWKFSNDIRYIFRTVFPQC